jgi:hypothetical protein
MNPQLSSLKLDHWYKVIIAVSFTVFLANGGGLLPIYPAKETALLSSGCFFIGLGEWINHPLQTKLIPGSVLTGYPRNGSAVGYGLVLIGIYLAYSPVRTLLSI